MLATQNRFLKLISGDEEIIIDACDGVQVIAEAKDFFPGIPYNAGSRFAEITDINSKRPTPKTAVEVYEVVKDATHVEMFASVTPNLHKLCLTQHQIKMFCKIDKEWLLRDGRTNFFLLKEKDQFFVTPVQFTGSWFIDLGPLGYYDIWDGESKRRIIVPKLS